MFLGCLCLECVCGMALLFALIPHQISAKLNSLKWIVVTCCLDDDDDDDKTTPPTNKTIQFVHTSAEQLNNLLSHNVWLRMRATALCSSCRCRTYIVKCRALHRILGKLTRGLKCLKWHTLVLFVSATLCLSLQCTCDADSLAMGVQSAHTRS